MCHARPVNEFDEVRAEIAEIRAESVPLRAEIVSARALAAMADRDVSEVRAAIGGIVKVQSALRETQVEQGQTLRHIADVVGTLAIGQRALEFRQGALKAEFTTLRTGQQALEARQTKLETGQAKFETGQATIIESFRRHDEFLAQLITGQSEILRRLESREA